MSIKDLSVTAASNTAAAPYGAPEGLTLANVNNVMRQTLAEIRTLAAEDTIASATTCDLGTKDATFLTITGTTTITGFGTVSAGIYKFVQFSGALTITHNATSLILLTGANRTTVAGDCGLYKSEGSGNWREYFYSDQSDWQPLDDTLTALSSALSAANKIPYATALDTLGELDFKDEDDMASNSATALPSQQSVKAYVDTQIAAIPDAITSGTAQASTSGTSIDFTGIPAGVKRVDIPLAGVSTSGTSNLLFQIGDSGGFETTGYLGGGSVSSGTGTTNGNFTTGFGLPTASAGNVIHGTLTLLLVDAATNTWVASGEFGLSNLAATAVCGGSKSLSGELTQVRITTVGGTDTLDLGTINVLYS